MMNYNITPFAIIIYFLVGIANISYAADLGNSFFLGDSTVNKTDSAAWNVDLAETTVTANNIIKTKNKLMAFPTKDMKKTSFDGYSILSMMMLPGVDVDEFDKNITVRNRATTICINGRQVDASEIRTLNPKDIKRVDYYQQHDPRFPQSTSVIDFIMRNRDHGGQVFLTAQQKLNMAAGDDIMDVKHFFKKAEMNLQVAGDYTHFTQSRSVEQTTTMQFPDQDIVKDEVTKPSPQHKNNINAKLSFLHRYGKTDMLQLAAYIKNGHNKNGSDFTETFSNGTEGSAAYDNQHTDNTAASFKGYFQRTFNEAWTFRTWLNGRYNHTNLDREKFSISLFDSNNKEDYYSVSPIIAVFSAKKKKWFNPVFSIACYYDKANGTYVENCVTTTNHLTNFEGSINIGNNMYLSDNLYICLQPDIEWLHTDNNGTKDTRWSFSPKAWIEIDVSDKDHISTELGIEQNIPEVKYYNEMEHTIDPYQKYRGNPNLKSGTNYKALVSYSHYDKWGTFALYTDYKYSTNNIYQSVEYDEGRYLFLRNYFNGSASALFKIGPQLTLKLINNKLRLKMGLDYAHQEERNQPDLKLDKVQFGCELQYMNKAFSSQLKFKTQDKQLASGYEITRPMSLNLSLGYTLNGWHFTFNAANPFMKSYVKTKFVADKYTQEKRSYSPKISYNMFNFSVAYRISYGKKHKFSDVEIDTTEGSAILTQ